MYLEPNVRRIPAPPQREFHRRHDGRLANPASDRMNPAGVSRGSHVPTVRSPADRVSAKRRAGVPTDGRLESISETRNASAETLEHNDCGDPGGKHVEGAQDAKEWLDALIEEDTDHRI